MFINKSPEVAFKKLLELFVTFYRERIGKLLEKLDFEPWQYDYRRKDYLYYSGISDIIEGISYSLGQSFRSLSHSLNWFLMKLRGLMHEIGRQNMLQQKIERLSRIKTELKEESLDTSEVEGRIKRLCQLKARSKFGETFVSRRWKFTPSSPKNFENNSQARGDPLTFLDRMKNVELLDSELDLARKKCSKVRRDSNG